LDIADKFSTRKRYAVEPLRVAGKCPFLLAGRGTLTKTFPFREAPAFGWGVSIAHSLGPMYLAVVAEGFPQTLVLEEFFTNFSSSLTIY
jgi:hypothetical protein